MVFHRMRRDGLGFFISSVVMMLTLQAYFPVGAAQSNTSPPQIEHFWVTTEVKNGRRWHVFHWATSGAERIRLFTNSREDIARSDSGWPASMAGSLSTTFSGDTTYELRAENTLGIDTRMIKVSDKGCFAWIDDGKKPAHWERCRTGPKAPAAKVRETCTVSGELFSPYGFVRKVKDHPNDPGVIVRLQKAALVKDGRLRSRATLFGGSKYIRKYRFERVPANEIFQLALEPGWAVKGFERVEVRCGRPGSTRIIKRREVMVVGEG